MERQEGEWKFYHEQWKAIIRMGLTESENYKNGKKEGEWKIYHKMESCDSN